MRLVILTGRNPEHCYVVDRLASEFGDSLLAIVVAEPKPRPLSVRVQSYWKRYTFAQIASRVAARVHDRATGISAIRRNAAQAYLFPQGDSGAMPREQLVRVVPGHNHPECLALLDALQPDVIAVFGTGVIREGVTSRARRAVLNLHTGISPRYRGADSSFWALHEGEPEWIGATVHVLTPALDAGPILGTMKIDPEFGDDEGRLFAKCVERGAELYVRMIRALMDGTVTPQPQDLSAGREFRFVDRTVAAERRVQRALRDGLLRRYPKR